MSLSLRDIRYSYSTGAKTTQAALLGVPLEVAAGELVLVIGTTGSGKSTLLRIASGLLAADSGEATIGGQPLDTVSARGRVGLVFQNAESQLFADSVLEDVAFGPRNLGSSADEARLAAIEALAHVGLDPESFGSRSPFSLSGGEARRVAFAGVLAMHPDFLLADEPTAGLDARGRAAIRRLLHDARCAAGVVVVSHTAEEFLGQADRVLVLDSGSCAWWGDAGELIENPEPLITAGLKPPVVLETQMLARQRGLKLGRITADVADAAKALADAGGW